GIIVCGNGIEEEGEACDDGNLDDGDGCDSTCQIEEVESNTISGYKYNDLDTMASTTDDLIGISDWIINLYESQSTSTPLFSTSTDSLGYYEFTDLLAGDYSLTEDIVAGWVQLSAPSAINLTGTSTISANNNFVNYFEEEEPVAVCGNGEIEDEEVCDDGILNGTADYCNLTCDGQTPVVIPEPTDTSGGSSPIALTIYNEDSINITETGVTITWFTNHLATSRIVYSAENEPHDFDYNMAPNYGYANSTVDDLTMVTFHQIELTDLIPGTLYYYRVISHASPDTVGLEYSFTTSEAVEEELPEDEGTGGDVLPDEPVDNSSQPGGGEPEEDLVVAGDEDLEDEEEVVEPEEDTTIPDSVKEDVNGQVAGAQEEQFCYTSGNFLFWLLVIAILGLIVVYKYFKIEMWRRHVVAVIFLIILFAALRLIVC
ncbi:MAG: fibronectin type III domain-containing protein, partial [Candidatus Komeilibacteria bacterium]